MAWFCKHRRKLLYGLVATAVLLAVGIWGGIQYFKGRFFTETANTLTINGELQTVPFLWVKETFSDEYVEPHSAILIPVRVPGIDQDLHMQFDTGSPYTFFRSGCLESLKQRGVDLDIDEENGKSFVRRLALNVGGNSVLVQPGRVMRRDISIDWQKPYNNIGTLGADFLADVVSAIDFPAAKIFLFRERPEHFRELGEFHPFEFRARRILLPATIQDVDLQVFWDSGCSSFGLFTSKYHFENYARSDDAGISFQAMRFGDRVPVHHRPSDVVATFGQTDVALQRVSYVDMYTGLQSAFGRFIDGGFLGNKSLTGSTLILDTTTNEFLIVNGSIPHELAGP